MAKEPRVHQISFRISAEEMRRLDAIVDRRPLTRNGFARHVFLIGLHETEKDPLDAIMNRPGGRPRPPTGTRRDSSKRKR